MKLLLESFGRALAYCLLPQVWLLTILPLVGLVVAALLLGYFFWESTVAAVQLSLESSTLMTMVWDWFQSIGLGGFKTVVAPLIVIALSTPLLVVGTLLVVAFAMTPALVRLVARRRFPQLEERGDTPWWRTLTWSLGSTLAALLALVLSIPLWVILPLVLVLPPMIWGWLTYRVMAFDALVLHASTEERRALFKRHRLALFAMGLLAGGLSAAPGLIWASSAFAAVLFALLAPLVIWLYTFVFCLSSLWFVHYGLAALQQWRAEQIAREVAPAPSAPVIIAPKESNENAPN